MSSTAGIELSRHVGNVARRPFGSGSFRKGVDIGKTNPSISSDRRAPRHLFPARGGCPTRLLGSPSGDAFCPGYPPCEKNFPFGQSSCLHAGRSCCTTRIVCQRFSIGPLGEHLRPDGWNNSCSHGGTVSDPSLRSDMVP